MLYHYKKDFEKIAMGLMSYASDLNQTDRLMEEMDLYRQDSDRKLFLWKSEETSDFVAILGVEIEQKVLLLRLIALSPSYRNEGLSYKMLDALQAMYQDLPIMGTLETTPIIQTWQQDQSSAEE
ncbi:hypothetical protein [Allofustis seminis]|uniref:hypothetical protein n=1 Tax=Allofustis seminis TaxID=166939 RepID=UPI00035C7817|nr:hypothetical protein [Allofustis seminis]